MIDNKHRVKALVLCSLFAALIAIGAFIKMPIPYMPFTLQFLFTSLAGILLGSKKGALAVGMYVLIGLIGLPIFTNGGGFTYIFQPTFGYLIGFILGTYITGWLVEKKKKPTYKDMVRACFIGLLVVYLIGMVYYYFIANNYMNAPIGVFSLILYCFILAVPGDFLLCFISSYIGKKVRPYMTWKEI